MKRILIGAALAAAFTCQAFGQSYQDTAGSVVPAIVPIAPGLGPLFTAAHPGYVQGSLSASFSGFTPTPAYSQLAVSATSARVALPAGTVAIVYNTGANTAFVQLGSASVVGDSGRRCDSAGSWMAFTVGTSIYLAGIETAGPTALNISGGAGLPTGAGGGGSNGLVAQGSTTSGQSGQLNQGAVTVGAPSGYADGKTSPLSLDTAGNLRVTITGSNSPTLTGVLPAFAATPTFNLGTLNGAATAALQTTGNTALTTINTTLGSPMQNSGGSVTVNAGTNTSTASLATSANQTNATQKTQIVDGSGNVIASTSNALNVNQANANANIANTSNGVSASSSCCSPVVGYAYVWNGSTWDRQKAQADPCATAAKSTADFNSATTGGSIVTAGGVGVYTYLCSVDIVNSASAAQHISLIEGTGSGVCAGGTPAGVYLNNSAAAANGANFVSGGGVSKGDGTGTIAKNGTANYNICVAFDGAAQVNVHVAYVQQ